MTSRGLTLAFLGFVGADGAERAKAFEDQVLPLVEDHGGRLLVRGRRRTDDPTQPFEVHVLWFPDRDALEGYLADPGRAELVARHGQVFASSTVVELDLVASATPPGPT